MRLALLAGLAAVALAAPAAANLVTNGSFETVTRAGNFEFGASFPANANAVVGWTSPRANAYNLSFDPATAFTPAGNANGRFVGGGREYLQPGGGAGIASPDGGRFVGLDGDLSLTGPMEQTIANLIVGQTYDLSFFWAAGQIASRTGATTEQLQVSFGNEVQLTGIVANPSAGFQGWFAETFTFTATSATQVLSFLSLGTPNGLPPIALLDGVSLVATPTPATLALMGLGILGLAAARRR